MVKYIPSVGGGGTQTSFIQAREAPLLTFLQLYHLWQKRLFFCILFLQSKQVKRTPQDSVNELIIWKMNPLVVLVTGVKFKSELLHA